MKHIADDQLPGRKWLFLGAILSLMFLFYGSLVPLDYEYKSLGEAWLEFMAVISKGLHVRSRADLGENFLLMVPVGFFWMGAVWPSGRRAWIFPFAATVLVLCLTSSCVIEFTQTFFRGRTPAFSDVLMQAMGSFAGIIAWRLWGYKIWILYFQRSSHSAATSRSTKILWAYLFVLIGYNIVPLDVTLNPYSIYQKYKAGRIVLVPFGFNYDHFKEFIYAITTDVLIWVPVGFLWCLAKFKKAIEACLWTLFAVIALETAQIFISSRIFDVTDIVLGSLGGVGGVLLALRMPSCEFVPLKARPRLCSGYRMTWVGIALFCLWCFSLALIFWFPYETLIERKFIETQLDRFFQVPFYVYYYSGGLTAVTAVLRKSLFFMPLGVFAFLACRPLRKFDIDSLIYIIALFCFLFAGAAIELGQVLMPNKIPDSTDLLFETLGGVLGFYLTSLFIKRSNG